MPRARQPWETNSSSPQLPCQRVSLSVTLHRCNSPPGRSPLDHGVKLVPLDPPPPLAPPLPCFTPLNPWLCNQPSSTRSQPPLVPLSRRDPGVISEACLKEVEVDKVEAPKGGGGTSSLPVSLSLAISHNPPPSPPLLRLLLGLECYIAWGNGSRGLRRDQWGAVLTFDSPLIRVSI